MINDLTKENTCNCKFSKFKFSSIASFKTNFNYKTISLVCKCQNHNGITFVKYNDDNLITYYSYSSIDNYNIKYVPEVIIVSYFENQIIISIENKFDKLSELALNPEKLIFRAKKLINYK